MEKFTRNDTWNQTILTSSLSFSNPLLNSSFACSKLLIAAVLFSTLLSACGDSHDGRENVLENEGSEYQLSSSNAKKIQPNDRFVYAINPNAKYDVNLVKVVFVDLFDQSTSSIARLKSQGKTVVCYFSGGSSENWRSDYKQFSSSVKGKKLDGWNGENWIDYRSTTVRNIMKARIALAIQKKCDGIDPDNIDGHLNDSGFNLSAGEQQAYMKFLSTEAHTKNLLIGLKNSAETASKIEPFTDFVVVEECYKYNECSAYKSFAAHSKAIFSVEYTPYKSSLCGNAGLNKISLIFSNLNLTSFKICR